MAVEARSESYLCDDAEVVLVACNTPARAAKGAVQDLRHQGVKAGLFRPITLWPFPIDALLPLAQKAKRLVVVEASAGQLEDEIRLALSRSEVRDVVPIEHVRRMGGMLPQQDDIVAKVQGSRPFAHSDSDGQVTAKRPEVQV
ncbi:MAG TPA: transketolase C-terminal domain-containing protein, partial [Thermoanaerobaculia bacterium]